MAGILSNYNETIDTLLSLWEGVGHCTDAHIHILAYILYLRTPAISICGMAVGHFLI